MQIVIDISDGEYEAVKSHPGCFNFAHAILNGTPLPKGHGRLIDADALTEKAPEIQEYLDVLAETVIEAGAESEDKE